MSKNISPNFFQQKNEENSDNASFQKEAEELIRRIEAAETTDLLQLAEIAELDPKTDFAGGDLRDVNLSGADLTGFDFSHANLSDADLSNANLSNANLLFTNLTDANLSNAIVEKARIGANLGLSEPMQIDLARRGARLEGKIKEVLSKWTEFIDSDRDWMTAHGDNKFLTTGDVLISQGSLIDAVYIVLKGLLDVVLIGESGVGNIASISATEMVGEMSFVKELPPSATVMARQETLVWSIPHSKLSEKLEEDSEFGYRFYRAISAVLAYRLKKTTLSLLNKEHVDQHDSSQEAAHEEFQTSPQQKEGVNEEMAALTLSGIVSAEELISDSRNLLYSVRSLPA